MTSTKAENGKSAPSDADRGANRTLYVVFLSLVIDLLGFTLILPLLPSILDYYGTQQDTLYQSIKDSVTGFRELVGAPDTPRWNSVLFGGVIGSLFSMLQFLASPIMGAASDVYGRKPVLVISMIGVAASYALWAVSHNFTLFVIARIIGGLSKGNVSISTAVIADIFPPEKRGKGMTGRGVPVLIPNETKKVLEYLSNPVARQRANIRPENNYMFANTGRTVVRAGESLDQVKFRSEVELRFPERIYANNLRKHTATIAQALNLNDTEMKWICNHLGHTQKVHDLVYRQTSGMIERLDIAKLMLIQEYNVVGKFQNRKLSEIQFDELGILEEKACYQDQEQQDIDNTAVQSNNVDDDMDIEEDFVSRKKAKKSERVRWSRDEEDEIKKYFSRYFDGHLQKKCPSREHCLDALKKSKENGGAIFKRKWETLKKKVSNMLVKLN